MLCYEGLYIGAAAVAKFYGLLVKDLVKAVVLGKVLAEQRQERFSYVCQNMSEYVLYKGKWGQKSPKNGYF